MKIKYLLIGFVCFLFVSCEEEYAIEDYDFKERLVINSMFSPDSVWSVKLSTSSNAFDPFSTIKNINDAEVSILNEDGEYICNLYNVNGKGKYCNTNFYPLFSKRYIIEVVHRSFGKVRAESAVPDQPVVENIILQTEELNDQKVLSFDIVDGGKSDDIFVWDIVTKDVLQNSDNFTVDSKGNTVSSDDVINPLSIVNLVREESEIQRSTYFNFENLGHSLGDIEVSLLSTSDDAITINVISNNPNVGGNQGSGGSGGSGNGGEGEGEGSGETNSETKRYIRILSVSKELYRYFESVSSFVNSTHTGSSSSNSSEIYSNVTGGLGIFGGYSTLLIPIE